MTNPEVAAALRAGAEALAAAITNLADAVRYHANVTGTQQKRAALALERVAKVLEHETRVPAVRGLALSFTSERIEAMAKKKIMVGAIKWNPAHPDEDVDHFELVVGRDGVLETSDHDKFSTGVIFEAPAGQKVSVSIVAVDDAGNRSAAKVVDEFVVVDNVAPGPVDGLAVAFTSERVEGDEPPAPEPEPAPPVDETPAPEPEPEPAPAPEEPLVD